MKYLLILLVIIILFILLYRRLRPYIATAQHILGIVRDVRRMSSSDGHSQASSEPLRRASQSTDRLLRCAACNTWIPTSRALKSSASGPFFCSRECLKGSAELARRRRASR